MPKFHVHVVDRATYVVTVTAAGEDAARELAAQIVNNEDAATFAKREPINQEFEDQDDWLVEEEE